MELCYRAAGGMTPEFIEPFVAAMYKVTEEEVKATLSRNQSWGGTNTEDPLMAKHKPAEPQEVPLISFPWLFPKIMCQIAKKSEMNARKLRVEDDSHNTSSVADRAEAPSAKALKAMDHENELSTLPMITNPNHYSRQTEEETPLESLLDMTTPKNDSILAKEETNVNTLRDLSAMAQERNAPGKVNTPWVPSLETTQGYDMYGDEASSSVEAVVDGQSRTLPGIAMQDDGQSHLPRQGNSAFDDLIILMDPGVGNGNEPTTSNKNNNPNPDLLGAESEANLIGCAVSTPSGAHATYQYDNTTHAESQQATNTSHEDKTGDLINFSSSDL
jgi:hypothetical protein